MDEYYPTRRNSSPVNLKYLHSIVANNENVPNRKYNYIHKENLRLFIDKFTFFLRRNIWIKKAPSTFDKEKN